MKSSSISFSARGPLGFSLFTFVVGLMTSEIGSKAEFSQLAKLLQSGRVLLLLSTLTG